MKEYNNIQITEKDLFNFVFHPDSINEEIKKTISEDKSISNVIKFYEAMKEEILNILDYSTKRLIAKKIPEYKLSNVVELHQLQAAQPQKKSYRLAADSDKELKPKIITKTFVDDEKNFMVKVLINGGNTKIFVFSTQDELLENFNLYIEPNNLEFHFKDNTEPLILEGRIEVEKIKIHFD